jgi:hypothetical protein
MQCETIALRSFNGDRSIELPSPDIQPRFSPQNLLVRLYICCWLLGGVAVTAQPALGSGSPSIQLGSVPPFGSSSGIISGRVINIDASKTSVATLVFIPGLGMFSKPSCSPSTLTPLNPDGTFSVQTVTGGVDPTATQIAVVAVPSTASVPCYGVDPNFPPPPGIPSALLNQALATALVYRANPTSREIVFSGRTWYAKSQYSTDWSRSQ